MILHNTAKPLQLWCHKWSSEAEEFAKDTEKSNNYREFSVITRSTGPAESVSEKKDVCSTWSTSTLWPCGGGRRKSSWRQWMRALFYRQDQRGPCVCVCEPCQPLARVKRSALFHMSQCKNLIKISDFTEKKKKKEVSVGSSEGKTTRPVVRTPTKILNT